MTQSPADVPDTVLGQLGNRVQHALRAFTPRDQKAVKTAADTLRPNPKLDVGRAITELAVGEALVSMLDAKGSPTSPSARGSSPPASRIGPVSDAERAAVREQTRPLYGHYEQAVDRESAYERLKSGAVGAGRAGGAGQVGAASRGRTGGNSDECAVGGLRDHRCAVRHPLRHHGTARRQARRPGAVGGEERGPLGRLGARPRDSARRAGIDPRGHRHALPTQKRCRACAHCGTIWMALIGARIVAVPPVVGVAAMLKLLAGDGELHVVAVAAAGSGRRCRRRSCSRRR